MCYYIGLCIILLAILALTLMNNPGASLSLANSDIARLASGLALLIVIGAGVILAYRGRIAGALRHAAIWLFLALIVLTGYSYRRELAGFGNRLLGELVPGLPVVSMVVKSDGSSERTVTIRAADDGHFHLRATVNGCSLDMLLDTGASTVSLTYGDAISVGIDPRHLFFSQTVDTANGRAEAAPIRLATVSVGGIAVHDLRTHVMARGRLLKSLLGMNYLRALSGFEVRDNILILRQ